MKTKTRSIKYIFLVVSLIIIITLPFGEITSVRGQSQYEYAQAIVLVNSTSPSYQDFSRYIQPYQDHFGIPYTTVDISTSQLPADLSSYALIIIGHRQLDIQNAYLDASEQGSIATAVNQGTGLVNFDNDLADENLLPHYQYVQNIFGFSYYLASAASNTVINSATTVGRYVVSLQQNNGRHMFLSNITPLGVNLPPQADNLATVGGQSLLIAGNYGQGRILQWTSYEWMKSAVYGYMNGMDDLIWRGFVWAARKPFIMQGLPPFVTMRVDDVSGPLQWLNTSIATGFRPWLGLFLNQIDQIEAGQISVHTNSGSASASVHSFDSNGFFFYDHQNRTNFPDNILASNYSLATQFHLDYGIPISKYVVPHFYEIGSNAFGGLSDWNVEFVATHMTPGNPYGSSWLMVGPYRKYESGSSNSNVPAYYADYFTIPGHPELDGRFFNCVTEPRGALGYEWVPFNVVSWDIARGTQILKRELSSMTLATLFLHEYNILPIEDANWGATLQGIINGVASYGPRLVTMDYACQYVRAMNTSSIESSLFDPASGSLDTTLVGSTDLPTSFYLFTEENGVIQFTLVDVPVFSNSVNVSYSFLPPTATPTSTPGPSPTPTNTPTPTATYTPSATPTATNTPTNTFTPTATYTPSMTPTPTATNTPTATPTATNTPTNTPTPTPTIDPAVDLIFTDGFESGVLSAWSYTRTNGGDLRVSQRSALTGMFGLETEIGNSASRFVRDDSPFAENHYRARFYFDPNSLAMAEGNDFQLFRGKDTSNYQLITLLVRFSGGTYRLQGGVITDANGWLLSSGFPFSDDVHTIEIDWRAASSSLVHDGGLTIWLDGNQIINYSGLDNDARLMDYVELGAVFGLDSGTSGIFYIDDFISHRHTYIGP